MNGQIFSLWGQAPVDRPTIGPLADVDERAFDQEHRFDPSIGSSTNSWLTIQVYFRGCLAPAGGT